MIFRRLMTIQWKNVFGMSRALAKRSGRSSASVFFDFVDCYRKRGATWFNYMNFAFDLKRDPAIRDTYATEYKDNGVMFRCNAPEIIESIRDKGLFNAAYREFIGRDYIDLRKTDREDYERFIARFDEVRVLAARKLAGVERAGSRYRALLDTDTSLITDNAAPAPPLDETIPRFFLVISHNGSERCLAADAAGKRILARRDIISPRLTPLTDAPRSPRYVRIFGRKHFPV